MTPEYPEVYGDNFLHMNRCPELVSILVKGGVDINKCNYYGFTPLVHFIVWTHRGIIRELVKFRPKTDSRVREAIKRVCPDAYRTWIRGTWSILKPCVKLLSLHARAVVTANHPSRIDFDLENLVECNT